jgi:ABC-type phosphate transport system substrate-binding protein
MIRKRALVAASVLAISALALPLSSAAQAQTARAATVHGPDAALKIKCLGGSNYSAVTYVSQGLACEATGGTPPYTWNVTSNPALPTQVGVVTLGANNQYVLIGGIWSAPVTEDETITLTDGPHGSSAARPAVTMNATITVTNIPDTDAVGVGSDTTAYLFDQLSADYNSKLSSPSDTALYSFDATNPQTAAIGDNILTKNNCALIARPDGSSAGIEAMDGNAQPSGDSTNYCIDFARSSRARESTDPPFAPGGITFVSLAGDAVTWASRNTASGGTDAPANLTTQDLVNIYECTDTNWDQVGGQNAPIEAFLPQTSSGTRTFFLTALGGGTTPITPGSCVSDLPTAQDPGGTLEENEGTNPALNSPEAIFIYSVGDYLAQVYHSPACIEASCAPLDGEAGALCYPPLGQTNVDDFGCNISGVLQLNPINSSDPAKPWPLTSSTTNATINSNFDLLFQRTLYDVVRYDANTTDHIPGSEAGAPGGVDLEQFFGATGYICTNATAQKAIKDYGFLTKWKLSTCGAVS